MSIIEQLLEKNRIWSEAETKERPEFFTMLAEAHTPEILWIGCSDGRVSPDKLVDTPLGTIFVHRNIGNLFAQNDLNCLAVVQHAVATLKVPDIIICGHHGCAGVHTALYHHGVSPVDLWVDQIRQLANTRQKELSSLTETDRVNRLAELNVQMQVQNICQTLMVQKAWAAGQTLNIHGLIYNIEDGRLKQITPSISNSKQAMQPD